MREAEENMTEQNGKRRSRRQLRILLLLGAGAAVVEGADGVAGQIELDLGTLVRHELHMGMPAGSDNRSVDGHRQRFGQRRAANPHQFARLHTGGIGHQDVCQLFQSRV